MKYHGLILFFLSIVHMLSARTVYVTRHGQVGDKNFFDQRVRDIKLTTLGTEQAQLLATYMVKERHFNGSIYVSPLHRTIETGLCTATLLDKKVILEPGLQEVAPKKTIRGMTLAEIEERFSGKVIPGKGFIDQWRLSFEDNETRQKRVSSTLEKILSESKDDLLLVTHGGIVGNLLVEFNHRLMPGVKKAEGIGWNCSLFTFELNDDNQVIRTSYTTEYLPDDKVTNNFRAPKIPRPNDKRYESKKPKIGSDLRPDERLLLIARHCQATGARGEGILSPIVGDGGVTELGLEQSRLLGMHLKKQGFQGVIFASPYFRTMATANEIALITGSKIYPKAEFQECVKEDGGNIKNGGATFSQLKSLFPVTLAKDAMISDDWLLKKKEEYTGFHQQRLSLALFDIINSYSDQGILIVTHGGAVAALLRVLKEKYNVPTINDTIWNCTLFQFALDKQGNCRYLGYTISFIPEEKVTSNLKYSLRDRQNGKQKDFQSGIDYKLTQ